MFFVPECHPASVLWKHPIYKADTLPGLLGPVLPSLLFLIPLAETCLQSRRNGGHLSVFKTKPFCKDSQLPTWYREDCFMQELEYDSVGRGSKQHSQSLLPCQENEQL